MTERAFPVVRGVLVLLGAGVIAAGLLTFRLEHWPIYLTFALVYPLVQRPGVEVFPNMPLPIPDLATTIGFIYVGGLPIIVLRHAIQLVILGVSRLVPDPRPWLGYILRGRWESPNSLPEWGLFSFGLGARWLVAMVAAPLGLTGAILVGEVVGNGIWGVFSTLPLFSYAPVSSSAVMGSRARYSDIGLIVLFAQTPFVLLVALGYAEEGVVAAGVFALMSLGLHTMLSRLNERRATVEAQNTRLETLNRELEHRERLSAIGKMSSVVSHQILHQLGVIGLYADLIRRADPTNGDPREGLARAQGNAGAIEQALAGVNRVLTDLLVFSRDLRLNRYPLALDAVVAEAVDEVRPEIAAAGVRIAVEVAPNVEVSLDKLKIKQALANLLRNARDVAPGESVIAVRATATAHEATITVTDAGPGVPHADREAIFTPFVTTKEHGTGLGLAIAREFVTAHGGTLHVEDATGGGATFIVRLPLAGPQPS